MSSALIRLFVPHQHNDHRAHVLHPFSLFLFIGIFSAFQIAFTFLPRFVPHVLSAATTITPEKIVELTNSKRSEAGLSALSINTQLTQSALAKAGDMFARDYWAHNAPDGTTPWSFFVEAGYPYRFAGENLARDFVKDEDVITAWMASPTHRDNMLSPKYDEIGVAVVDGDLKGLQTTLVVQHFGSRNSTATAPSNTTPPQSPPLSVAGMASEKGQQLGSQVAGLFSLTKNMAMVLVGIFLAVLILDVLVINHKAINRAASKSSAHILFLFAVLAVVLTIKSGLVL